MTTFVLYGAALLLLTISYIKDREKTGRSLIKAWKSFEGIMPQFLSIILIVGVMFEFLKPETISLIIGKDSGFLGIAISAAVGSITLMPTFVAFQTADMILKNGGGYPQVAALVSTLTLVGVITLPMESKHIGKRAALYRNLVALLFSFLVAIIIGEVMGG